MKVYSIGREAGCDIVINDNSDVVSRRHAVLNITSSGKMTIIDQSQNGTYVNGIRISSNVPVPVTRKDKISFAHVARLDWNLVPNTQRTIVRYIAIAIVVLLIGGAGIWFGTDLFKPSHHPSTSLNLPVDSLPKVKSEKEIRKEIQDSLNMVKAKEDSIKKAKVREDSIKKSKKSKSKEKKESHKENKENKDEGKNPKSNYRIK